MVVVSMVEGEVFVQKWDNLGVGTFVGQGEMKHTRRLSQMESYCPDQLIGEVEKFCHRCAG